MPMATNAHANACAADASTAVPATNADASAHGDVSANAMPLVISDLSLGDHVQFIYMQGMHLGNIRTVELGADFKPVILAVVVAFQVQACTPSTARPEGSKLF